MRDYHPFEPFIPKYSTKLIIGSIPPHRFCIPGSNLHCDDVIFYYGSRDNYFWDLIGEIYNIDFLKSNTKKAVIQRKKFLKNKKIGITDVIKSCLRENKSASDNKLKKIKPKNLSTLLSSNNCIDTLIYSSEFVKKCMNECLTTRHSIDKNDKKKQRTTINGKEYNVHILYSPSPQALRKMGKNGKIKRKKQYKKVFCDE